MSAFVVREQTIQNVVSIWFRPSATTRPVEQLDDIGRNLWVMNADAVSLRYSERPENLPKFHFRAQRCSKIQALKSARCLWYQCSEGNVPDRSLYKELEDVIRRLALEIVEELPEYDRAQWG